MQLKNVCMMYDDCVVGGRGHASKFCRGVSNPPPLPIQIPEHIYIIIYVITFHN